MTQHWHKNFIFVNKYNIKQIKPRKNKWVLAIGFRCLDLMIFILDFKFI